VTSKSNVKTMRGLAGGISALVAFGLLTACTVSGSPAASPGGSIAADGQNACIDKSVIVGTTNSVSDAPLIIADEMGYFKEEGLSVKFQPFASAGEMVPPLGAGQIDVGSGSVGAGIYNAVARGVDLRIVADKGTMKKNFEYFPLMVRKELIDNGTVKSIADLKGLRIAEPAPGVVAATDISAILQSAGLQYEDVKHVNLAPSQQLAAFANGSIDAGMVTEPTATNMENQAVGVRFALPPDYYGPQQVAALLYGGQFAKNKALGNCFMKAYLRGVREYLSAFDAEGRLTGENAEKVVNTVSQATGLDPALYSKIVPAYIDPNGKLNLESLEKDYDFFDSHNMLEGDRIDIHSIIDQSFVEAAVTVLGDAKSPTS
jgi:NitT/TauT family transport system substrate-binding protein